jgi:hypothetical protein
MTTPNTVGAFSCSQELALELSAYTFLHIGYMIGAELLVACDAFGSLPAWVLGQHDETESKRRQVVCHKVTAFEASRSIFVSATQAFRHVPASIT